MDTIKEKIFIQVNGNKIGMFIEGNNLNAPVLLFLHGGPGMPQYGLTQKYPTFLEEHFIVCWYEQRGAGLSYDKAIDYEQMTIENIILDTIEVTNYLRERFQQDKIYLIGHSWGTLIGIKTIKQYPELFHAYIGVAQIVNQLKSEKLAYQYMLEQYKEQNNRQMIKKLERFNILESNIIPLDYVKFRDKPMHELGIGTTYKMKSVITGIFLPIMRNKNYTFSERINIWRAKSKILNNTNLWEKMTETGLFIKIDSVDIPIYFLHGIFDYTVNYSLTQEYFDSLNAPTKRFYTFDKSAHSPIFEEPERVTKIILEDVLDDKASIDM
ncbi:MAG: alpha/beta hydrolase [Candidatus Cloacimonetes bacterium]|nr:alpha/beta hydrolase [Candidatus Cloacimonadota bacterium]